jgi:hypothetical protein
MLGARPPVRLYLSASVTAAYHFVQARRCGAINVGGGNLCAIKIVNDIQKKWLPPDMFDDSLFTPREGEGESM